MSKEYAKKVLELIDKSPTAFHVVENARAILDFLLFPFATIIIPFTTDIYIL